METKKLISILRQAHSSSDAGDEIEINGKVFVSKKVNAFKISESLSLLTGAANHEDFEDFETTIEEEYALIQLGKSELPDYVRTWVNYQFNRRYELKNKQK